MKQAIRKLQISQRNSKSLATSLQNGNFKVYAPNAFDKKTCDPEWTNFDWPCRGTKDTCMGWLNNNNEDDGGGDLDSRYMNVLTKDGHPTDDCCWRYSFRSQLQEAKETGGFMLQLVQTEPTVADGRVRDATLGNGIK